MSDLQGAVGACLNDVQNKKTSVAEAVASLEALR